MKHYTYCIVRVVQSYFLCAKIVEKDYINVNACVVTEVRGLIPGWGIPSKNNMMPIMFPQDSALKQAS